MERQPQERERPTPRSKKQPRSPRDRDVGDKGYSDNGREGWQKQESRHKDPLFDPRPGSVRRPDPAEIPSAPSKDYYRDPNPPKKDP